MKEHASAVPANFSDIKKKRRRRRAQIFILLAVSGGCLLAVGIVWLVNRTALFRLADIEVEGLRTVPAEQVVDVLRAKLKTQGWWRRVLGVNNLLAWPGSITADDLKFIPAVYMVQVHKNYGAHVLTIKAQEREPVGIWCQRAAENASLVGAENENQTETACWWFDPDGVLFRRSALAEGSLIKTVSDYYSTDGAVGLGKKILPAEFLPPFFSILNALTASGLRPQEIRLNDLSLQEMEVTTYNGPKLYFSLRFPAAAAVPVIRSLAEAPGLDKIQYIDFRVEHRAYYK